MTVPSLNHSDGGIRFGGRQHLGQAQWDVWDALLKAGMGRERRLAWRLSVHPSVHCYWTGSGPSSLPAATWASAAAGVLSLLTRGPQD